MSEIVQMWLFQSPLDPIRRSTSRMGGAPRDVNLMVSFLQQLVEGASGMSFTAWTSKRREHGFLNMEYISRVCLICDITDSGRGYF